GRAGPGGAPAALDERDVLDQSADAQRAGGWRGTTLLVGQAIGDDPERISLLREVGEETLALVGDRGYESWHADTAFSGISVGSVGFLYGRGSNRGAERSPC